LPDTTAPSLRASAVPLGKIPQQEHTAYFRLLKETILKSNALAEADINTLFVANVINEFSMNANTALSHTYSIRDLGISHRGWDGIFSLLLNGDPGKICLGEPGIGKTMLVDYFVLRLIEKELSSESGDQKWIPVVLRMHSYDGSLSFEQNIMKQMGGFSKYYQSNKNRILLILDALDEMPDEHIGHLSGIKGYLSPDSFSGRWIATCRDNVYHSSQSHQLRDRGVFFKIQKWDLNDIESAASALSQVARKDVTSAMDYLCGGGSRSFSFIKPIWRKFNSYNQASLFWDSHVITRTQTIGDPQFLNRTESSKWKQMLRNGLLPLARTPYLLRLIFEVFSSGGVTAQELDNPSIIIKYASDRMIQEVVLNTSVSQNELHRFLCFIAQGILTKNESGVIETNYGREYLKLRFKDISNKYSVSFAKLLELSQKTKMVTCYGGEAIFSHKMLQDYFITVSIYNDIVDGKAVSLSKSDMQILFGWNDAWVNKISDFSCFDIEGLIETMLQCKRGTGALDHETELHLVSYCNSSVKGASVSERVKCYRVLGWLEQLQKGVGCSNTAVNTGQCEMIPDIEWCEIHEGFRVSKYPVTVAQYAAFIDDRGYVKKYWTKEGYAWKLQKKRNSPINWANPTSRVYNQPMVNVSWYEAVAFCNWLSSKICTQDSVIRLLRENEWDLVAQRAVPSREHNDEAIHNGSIPNYLEVSREHDIECAIAVGLCPSAEGLPSDMYGNVWEWCEDSWTNIEGEIRSPRIAVIKGGSWRNRLSDCDRDSYAKQNSADCIGFRICEVDKPKPMKIYIDDEYSTLKTVLMGRIDNFYLHDPINRTQRHFYENSPPTPAKLMEEQNSFVQVLHDHSVDIIWAERLASSPNQINTRDIAFVIGSTLFVSSMKEPIRKAEPTAIQSLYEQMENVVFVKDGVIEGGDVLVHQGTVYIGISERTNNEGIGWLKNHLPAGYTLIPILLKEGFLHLDTVFNIVRGETALCCREAIEPASLKKIEELFFVIDVDFEEQFSLATNVFSVTPNDIVVDIRNQRTNEQLAQRGFHIIPLDFQDISKIGGLFRCSTCPLLREGST